MKPVTKKAALVLIVFICMALSSCSAPREFLATLGFDTHDYEGEPVTATHEPDSDIAAELSEMTGILTINSPYMPEFKNGKTALSQCRDAVLNFMLNTGYAKYTGNIELLDKASQEYPQMQFSVIIPATDFRTTVYKYFGGKEKADNKDGKLFTYLEKVDAYVTAAQPQQNRVQVTPSLIEETENTYRFTFTCKCDDAESPEYFALIIKRADGSCYFKYLKET